MSGWNLGTNYGQYHDEVRFYSKAIELVKWCQQKWKDVPADKKGVVLEPTFLTLLMQRYLHVMFQVSMFS